MTGELAERVAEHINHSRLHAAMLYQDPEDVIETVLEALGAEQDDWRMKAEVNAKVADRLGRMLEAAEAERDALSARLQAVRDWATADHGGVKRPIDIWPGLAAALAPLDASLGTPGDEKPPFVHTMSSGVTAAGLPDELPPDLAAEVDAQLDAIDEARARAAASAANYVVRGAGPGDEKPSEPESMVWHRVADHRGCESLTPRSCADKIVAWVNSNGGEARYVPNGEDTPIGWSGYPRIAIRTAYGWAGKAVSR